MVNCGRRQNQGRSRGRDVLFRIESLKTSLLQRVAQAVEASADVLADLQAEFEASRAKPQERSHADAVQDIASELGMPGEKVEADLATLESQPRVVQAVRMRRMAEV